MLHPVGSGTSCVEDCFGNLGSLDLSGPPCIPLGCGLTEGVTGGCDLLCDSLVDGKRCDTLLDEPCPYDLPKLYELDLGVTDLLTVSASSTLVHCVNEIGGDGCLSSDDLIDESESGLVQLVQVVDLSSRSNGFPGSLPVGLTDVDTVTAHLTLYEFPSNSWESDSLRH